MEWEAGAVAGMDGMDGIEGGGAAVGLYGMEAGGAAAGLYGMEGGGASGMSSSESELLLLSEVISPSSAMSSAALDVSLCSGVMEQATASGELFFSRSGELIFSALTLEPVFFFCLFV